MILRKADLITSSSAANSVVIAPGALYAATSSSHLMY